MIQRSWDADYLNWLVNHPHIRPHVGGDGQSNIDLAPLVANNDNFLLLGPSGGFFYNWTAPETYEVHTFILPEGRGPQAFALAREGLEFMASQGATHVWTRVEETARNTRIFALKAGFKPCGRQVLDLGGGPTAYDLFNWRPPCPS